MYDHKNIEKKWQQIWENNSEYEAIDFDTKPKYYVLSMFPYPSGNGLHVGHISCYTPGDVLARYKKMCGFNVLHPMGYDSFGLPAEQKAIKDGTSPQESTTASINIFRQQLKSIGFAYDWKREISTSDPDYYKFTQWIFLKLLEKGYAYESETEVNWCEELNCVLANDEVINGKSERGEHIVTKKKMKQWMIKITDFAESLLSGLDNIDWPESTRKSQKNWIGKEEINGVVSYKLHDWVFSRQRYWGEPIPILKKNGVFVSTIKELPLILPKIDDYKNHGISPLENAKDWITVSVDSEIYEREIHTMPGSAGSSWYYLRYCDPHNSNEFCSKAKSDYWMPVDMYIGGKEHTTGHLLYSRMWNQFLQNEGLVRDSEPFQRLRHQGMVLGETFYLGERIVIPEAVISRDGNNAQIILDGNEVNVQVKFEKMSKRNGNYISPDEMIQYYGADALRIYLLFLAPLESDKFWKNSEIKSHKKWLDRVCEYFKYISITDAKSKTISSVMNQSISKITKCVENIELNVCISQLHIFFNKIEEEKCMNKDVLCCFLRLLHPFAPHISSELLYGLGETVGKWPTCIEEVSNIKNYSFQINAKHQATIEANTEVSQQEIEEIIRNKYSNKLNKTIKKVVFVKDKVINFVI